MRRIRDKSRCNSITGYRGIVPIGRAANRINGVVLNHTPGLQQTIFGPFVVSPSILLFIVDVYTQIHSDNRDLPHYQITQLDLQPSQRPSWRDKRQGLQ
jgi:hypothetical protein